MINAEISRLISSGSTIRRIWADGQRLKKAHGAENVADVTLGNPLTAPPTEVTCALEDLVRNPPSDLHYYTANAGHPAAREQIAAHLQETGLLPQVQAKHVVLTCGASAAINVILRAILDSGDEVMILAPFYPDYPVHIANYGCVPIVVSTDEHSLPDLEAIAAALSSRTRALIINHPNNPSGRQYPESRLRELAEILHEHGRKNGHPVVLISDEPYRGLRYTDEPYVSPAKLYDHGVMVYTFSKSHAIPGARIGYIAVNPAFPEVERTVEGFALANRILGFTSAPALWQRVVARCQSAVIDLTNYHRHRRRLIEVLQAKGYRVDPPEGGFYLFPKVPGDDNEFCRRAMDDLLLIVPGSTFGSPGHIRIAFCVDDHTIDLVHIRLPHLTEAESFPYSTAKRPRP